MSISGAMNSAVSALKAQSQALAMISDNLANSSTTGYKATTASFSTLVTQQSTGDYYPSGGVLSSSRQNVSDQGLITETSVATDLAIDGDGMFVVTYGNNGGEYYFTRDGEFDIDSSGYLCNGNYYLQGWETDAEGNVVGGNTTSTSTLESINVNRFGGYAAATTEESFEVNLPADAETGDTFTSSMKVYDSLGVANSVDITWEKTATNEWSVSFSDPVLSSDSTVTTGTLTGGPITVTFDSDGNLASTSPSPVSLSITGWTTGASDSTISLDLGTVGSTDGLSQFASNSESPSVSVTNITADGLEYGNLSGIEIDTDGTVIASYDNGFSLAIYKIPVATFTNVNGLESLSGNVYSETVASGDFTLQLAGEGTAGEIRGNCLEDSNVDTSTELTRMIVAQQAYSAASQVISTSRDMFDTLMSAVRS